MIRLLMLAYWHTSRLALKFLWQFEWFQRFTRWYLKVVTGLVILTLIVIFLWDLLPFVALAYMGHHVIRFQHRNDWV